MILKRGFTFEISLNDVDILNIPLEIPDDALSEKRKDFNISIDSVRAFKSENSSLARSDALTAIDGEEVAITIYDNDSEY